MLFLTLTTFHPNKEKVKINITAKTIMETIEILIIKFNTNIQKVMHAYHVKKQFH